MLKIATICLLISSSVYAEPDHFQALYLDGDQGYVLLPAEVTKDLYEATVEAWVRYEKFQNWSRVFDFGVEGNAAVLQNEKNKSTLHFAIWDREGKRHRVTAKKAVETGRWHHVAVSTNGEELAFYIDGQQVGGTGKKLMERIQMERTPDVVFSVGSFSEVHGGNNYIGKSNWESDALLKGHISEFRVWDVVKTWAEIQSGMNRQLVGNEPRLRAYYRFDRGGSDLSGNGYDAILHGAARVESIDTIPLELVRAAVDTAQLQLFRYEEVQESVHREFALLIANLKLFNKDRTGSSVIHNLGKVFAEGESRMRYSYSTKPERHGRWRIFYRNGLVGGGGRGVTGCLTQPRGMF